MAASFKSSPKAPSPAVPPCSTDTHRPRPGPGPQSQSQPQPQPQPQSQPQSQPQQQQPEPQPEPKKPPVDGKSYYRYLFNDDKSPTDTLDGLLRALGQYITDHVGDTNDKQLNPRKLAAFYHAVGGDYDSLFLKSPDRTISYIWQALGVQHTLQPIPDNDYAPPSVPALTLRGFVRWQSLQILLGPEEHVPYLQHAVANWNLKHPYTGDAFPVDLPASVFPSVCDPAVDEWHRACGEKLREAATPMEEEKQPRRHGSDSRMPTDSCNTAHGVSAGGAPRHGPESEYFQRRRPMSYVHVPEPRYPQHTSHPSHPIAPEANHRVSSSSGSSLDGLPRRPRRHSDIKPPPVIVREDTRSSTHLDPHRPPNVRRHSHTYQSPYASSVPNSDSEPDTLRPSPRHNNSAPQPPPPSVRRVPGPPPIPATTSSRSRRLDTRADDSRRISLPAEIKQKFASLLSSSNRQRSTSREPGPARHSSVRYRKELPRTRLSRSLSGESYTSDGSLSDITAKYSPRDGGREHDRARERMMERERERGRELEREREREREKIREWEMERKSRKEKAYLRPTISRRTSSHADVDRRRQDVFWDARDRRREGGDLEREVRRNLTSDELDRRERRRYPDRGPSPTVTGVGGRRYPR
ncbi:hypothetical protein F4823DRAFT_603864 [Ustulina deusta]|nr:hypothetical protein F4823DRAFT_603864 [Ustulina deusta]